MKINATIHAMFKNHSQTRRAFNPVVRVALAFLFPIAIAVLVSMVVGNYVNVATIPNQGVTAVLLTAIGVSSLLLGIYWYGMPGMGLRWGRPFFAGVGFAFMGWLAFLVFRFIFVAIDGFGAPNATRTFIYLLLFEALALQIWTFGLLFHAISDWRGPLTAAITGGIVFGLTATLLFQEAILNSPLSILFFLIWGIMYGIIRLRAGSLLGPTLVQATQSYTAWVVMIPPQFIPPGQLNNLYLASIVAYLIIIWRLWPKAESDYRV